MAAVFYAPRHCMRFMKSRIFLKCNRAALRGDHGPLIAVRAHAPLQSGRNRFGQLFHADAAAVFGMNVTDKTPPLVLIFI